MISKHAQLTVFKNFPTSSFIYFFLRTIDWREIWIRKEYISHGGGRTTISKHAGLLVSIKFSRFILSLTSSKWTIINLGHEYRTLAWVRATISKHITHHFKIHTHPFLSYHFKMNNHRSWKWVWNSCVSEQQSQTMMDSQFFGTKLHILLFQKT